MRLHGLTLLALITGCLGVQDARASSDDSCYPSWNLKRDTLDVCNSLPFLSPGNDSRVNLQLLLADAGQASIPNRALSDDEQQLGYGQVPFPLARWIDGAAPDSSGDGNAAASTAQLADLVARIGLPADSVQTSADSFASGEGSRCRSNNATTAQDFLGQLLLAEGLSAAERQGLARARLTLLGACQWDETQLSVLLPNDLQGASAKAFRSYLKGAADFYSGRFGEALKSFRALQDGDQPWLKETSRYMVARALLNEAQQNAFDEMGYPDLRKVDKKILTQAESALGDYLKRYPQGQYSASAKGLTRRVYWLMSDEGRLAGEYAELFARDDADDLVPLVQEVDNKLLVTAHPADVRDARLLAVLDLMQMRHHEPSEPRALDAAGLAGQQDLFAKSPGLHAYLTAAYHLYVEEKPAEALKSLPEELPQKLDYLAFSQQTLRGFALEAGNDWIGAEKLWLRLMPLAEQPLQRDQLELALAFNYERSDRLVKVFAEGSPVHTPIIREILLRHVAGPELLRQQARSTSISVEERDTAIFALLYKDLLHGQYQAFIDDLALLPTDGSGKPLGASIGYLYGSLPLSLFQWPGGKNDSGYECPAIVDVARDLLQSPQPPKALNCLGEFILRNNLDGFPLDSQPSERELGGGESLFPGTAFSRMDGYLKVIADKQAPEEDRAYALFRAINCYAPSGFNGCGSQDIAPAQRKQWFRALKGQYAATPWAKSLKYYW